MGSRVLLRSRLPKRASRPGGPPRLEPPRTTAIRASTAAAATITATAPRQNHQHKDAKNTKTGNLAAPRFANLLCRLGSDANSAYVFGRRAPQERCDSALLRL